MTAERLPSIVIAGRPNVGKSTLFNRLTGTRRSIVTDEPGITRDRIYGRGAWRGRAFEVVDTGGMLPEDKAAIPREIVRQAEVAIQGATLLVLVADARAGLVPLDAELARRLRRTGKPLVVAANKVDTSKNTTLASAFYELGADVFPISAEHGTGIDDLLDAVTKSFPAAAEPEAGDDPAPARVDESGDGEIQVAIIGRPNVGKSTLLNALAGDERAIVSPVAGTTRDAVDTEVEHAGKNYRFIDTAGIRRKGKTNLLAEKLSVIMARKHLERADVALVVADAAAGISAGDATIAGYAHESGRSVIIVLNKWDLAIQKAREAAEKAKKEGKEPPRSKVGKGKYKHGRGQHDPTHEITTDPKELAAQYEPLIRERLKFLDYAPIVEISALTGERVEKLYALIDRVGAARRRRISTGELNRWLANVDLDRGTSPSARRVKIFYVTQASSSPPTFILFTNQKDRLHFSYERFLENRLREAFDFTGAPIRFIQRVKEIGTRERARAAERRSRLDLRKRKPD
jgi:GTPase